MRLLTPTVLAIVVAPALAGGGPDLYMATHGSGVLSGHLEWE